MEDTRAVGMKVWHCPPYGGMPTVITVTKVLQRQVTCDDGNKYNLAPGDTWGMHYGSKESMVKRGEITTVCQLSRVADMEERQRRMALICRLDVLLKNPRNTAKLQKLVEFLEEQENVQN